MNFILLEDRQDRALILYFFLFYTKKTDIIIFCIKCEWCSQDNFYFSLLLYLKKCGEKHATRYTLHTKKNRELILNI